jgi:hypothetical protein
LLQKEDHECDHETDEISLPKKCLLEAETFAGFSLLQNCGFNFRHFVYHSLRVDGFLTEVGKVCYSLAMPPDGGKPTGRFLYMIEFMC